MTKNALIIWIWKKLFSYLKLTHSILLKYWFLNAKFCAKIKVLTFGTENTLIISGLKLEISGQRDTCIILNRDVCPKFLSLGFGQIPFFCVGNFLSYFLGSCATFPLFFWVWQISSYFFWGVFQILYPFTEEQTVLKNVKF